MNKEAYSYSIKLLSKRDYSSFKLKQKLIARNYTDSEIIEIINTLKDKKFINDKNYALSRAKSFASKGLSNNFLIRRLEQEELYLDDEEVNALRTDYNLLERDIINQLINKKIKFQKAAKSPEELQKQKVKLISYLASKGHSYDSIQDHLPKALVWKLRPIGMML